MGWMCYSNLRSHEMNGLDVLLQRAISRDEWVGCATLTCDVMRSRDRTLEYFP